MEKRKRVVLSCCVLVGVVLVAAGLFSWWMIDALDSPVQGWQETPTTPRPSAPISFSVRPEPSHK
ncbi:hypothetical protein [Streptomyces sp. NPDC020742]|uniref:hypothetical protein n=1 Tax=unclassified Streptomyces TaxID=2593676 RepID=UPI0033F18A12